MPGCAGEEEEENRKPK